MFCSILYFQNYLHFEPLHTVYRIFPISVHYVLIFADLFFAEYTSIKYKQYNQIYGFTMENQTLQKLFIHMTEVFVYASVPIF